MFAGIGGIGLGLERAGMTCKWQVEIDDYATKVLEKHWPDVKRYRDVKEVGKHNLESVDLIAGGFPCQDISYAGKGAGIDGSRSGLWSEFRRVICELRPRYVLVENVPALLNRGIERVLGQLSEIGYDAEWQSISARAVGALHKRERVFIVGYTYNYGQLTSQESKGVTKRSNNSTSRSKPTSKLTRSSIKQEELAYSTGKRLERPAFFKKCQSVSELTINKSWWDVEPSVGRVADGVSSRVDRLRCLGNAVVPQVAEYIGKQIMDVENV